MAVLKTPENEGQIVTYNTMTSSGVIKAKDGTEVSFHGNAIHDSSGWPSEGTNCLYDVNAEGRATLVFVP